MNTGHDAIVATGTRLHVYRIELKFARFFAIALSESLELDHSCSSSGNLPAFVVADQWRSGYYITFGD